MNLLPHANADFMMGVHQPDDEYRLACYVDDPAAGEIYSGSGESQAAAGGIILTNYRVKTNNGKAQLHFSDVHLDGVSMRYRYAVLFNATKGGRTIAQVDVGRVVGVEFGVMSIYMPEDGLVEFGGSE